MRLAYKTCCLLTSIVILFVSPITFSQNTRETGESLYEHGLTLYRKGLYHESISVLNRSLFLNAANLDAYVIRAACKEHLGDHSGALTDLNSCLELKPDNYEVLFKRAVLRYHLNRFELAKQDFIRLLTLPVTETNTVFYRQSAHRPGTNLIFTAQSQIRSQLYNYLGLIDIQLKQCSDAVAWLDSAIRLSPNEADYYVNRFLAKQQCGKPNPTQDLEKALRLNPNHALGMHHLALTETHDDDAVREKRFTEAIAADSLLLDPYLKRANFRLSKNDYAGALRDYTVALKLKADDPEIWLNRGLVREKLTDFAGAYADFSRAIDLQEDYVKAWLNRGNLLALQKRYAEALEDYSVALIYKPDYAAAYYNRALAYYHINKPDEACTDLKRAEELNQPVDLKVKKRICKHP